jgi:hypothetical protein
MKKIRLWFWRHIHDWAEKLWHWTWHHKLYPLIEPPKPVSLEGVLYGAPEVNGVDVYRMNPDGRYIRMAIFNGGLTYQAPFIFSEEVGKPEGTVYHPPVCGRTTATLKGDKASLSDSNLETGTEDAHKLKD